MVVFVLLFNTLKAQNKIFHKGDFLVNPGIDLSSYKTNIRDAYNNKVFNGKGLNTTRIIKNTTDGSRAAICHMTVKFKNMEPVLHNNLSQSLSCAFLNYLFIS